jgi:hypothetical protein
MKCNHAAIAANLSKTHRVIVCPTCQEEVRGTAAKPAGGATHEPIMPSVGKTVPVVVKSATTTVKTPAVKPPAHAVTRSKTDAPKPKKVAAVAKAKPATTARPKAAKTAKATGAKPGTHKFTDAQVRTMRQMRKDKKSYSEIAKKFGLSSIGATWNIVNKKAYAEVK